jgi:hypothetical protein
LNEFHLNLKLKELEEELDEIKEERIEDNLNKADYFSEIETKL